MQLDQAKQMLSEDPKIKNGWKFDHVWSIIKDFEMFQDENTRAKPIPIPNRDVFGYVSLEYGNLTPQSARNTSSGLSSFSLNLEDSDDIIGDFVSQRPIGVKKAKLKRKTDDQTSMLVNNIEEGNRELLEHLKKASTQRELFLEMQQTK
ncbi:hypothetical protein Ccrd_005698 [Cynara cardunculus var. scolymus]|uniref:No apical meristem-associated C-terminal domain-containing protein n=1 Tax=Cynara cardunculus var. scolymus TaxID=59895 RepID=A0A103XKB1_CYNCS|nr:hypothetical protein Ccrd_005698 [Cynara cardunculus var. scolymus]